MKKSVWLSGLVGVVIFSGSLPATRVAVAAFSPLFLTSVRAVVAAILALAVLGLRREALPARRDLVPLVVVALGVVIGFPLLTALALQTITASHSIVFVGLLPLSTATFGVLRGGERPSWKFWASSVLGACVVVGFALAHGGMSVRESDLLMLAAIVVCGLGYAEGAVLARRLGGWQVIAWALVCALPVTMGLAATYAPSTLAGVSASAWVGLAYVSIFSMFVGFVFWYRALVVGGIAKVGQLQLLQPFFGLALAAVLLGEPIAWTTIATTIVVVLCVVRALY